jgi:hypothetical protein
MRRFRRAAPLAALWLLAGGSTARADFLVTPFLGTTFGAETGFLILDQNANASKNTMFGGSWAWLSDRLLGVEGEAAFAPGFFAAENVERLVTANHVTTVFGNVMAAVPISVSREGLRPYLLAGLGLVRIRLEDPVGLVNISNGADNSLGLQLGAGAIGFLTNRAGLRFDLRHVRSLARTTDPITLERASKLSFWRASIGVAIRY